MKIQKNNTLAFGLIFILTLVAISPAKVHADSLLASISMTDQCTSLVNGSRSSKLTTTSGSDTNITINNADLIVDQNVSGSRISGPTTLQKNAKESTQNTITYRLGAITSPTTITFTPITSSDSGASGVNYCPTGSSPISSSLVISPVAAPTASSTPKTTTKKSTTATTATPTPVPPAESTIPSSEPSNHEAQKQELAASFPVENIVSESNNSKWLTGFALIVVVFMVGSIYFLKKNKINNTKQLKKYLKSHKKNVRKKK